KHCLPKRHLIAYSTKHDGLNPFRNKGLRPSSLFSTANPRINAPTFSGLSCPGALRSAVGEENLLPCAGRVGGWCLLCRPIGRVDAGEVFRSTPVQLCCR